MVNIWVQVTCTSLFNKTVFILVKCSSLNFDVPSTFSGLKTALVVSPRIFLREK